MAFAPGDIVQLKSGSPALTVVSTAGEGVSVIWFAEELSEFRDRVLPAVALDKLEVADFDEEDDEDEDEADED
ncbi:DUF2158 domain-containing protein [Xanthobacter dioxanivorans]|uniref:DUF2158 domain-containing protein n=1 Tax=Xanthobacter dioxanivorans TaxID=2528964 RepID=A0A974SKG7_9HYPH|nr:DUF2158 domain-containing protein [Xanthobacter dioxanivorans]QRG08830.1 DUF2158 domain-containing protein [Xanthobacter dioxanivorans]